MYTNEYVVLELHRIRENEAKKGPRRGRPHTEIIEDLKREALREKKNRK